MPFSVFDIRPFGIRYSIFDVYTLLTMRCVLVGNYGVGNIGDEALREYFLQEFSDVEWSVVTAVPSGDFDVPRLPLGLRSLCAGWARTIRAIRTADLVVFGGGSLFTDIESVWACCIWGAYASLAQLFRVPYVLAFQGAGPWTTWLGKRISAWVYRHASGISVRDEASLARVLELSPKAKPVLTFDPAFARFSQQKKNPISQRLVLIPRTNSDSAFVDAVEKKRSENFADVRILLMQPDRAERRVGERLKAICGEPATVIDVLSVYQLLDEVSAASDVLAQRYHGALAALAVGVPVRAVPQIAGDKMDMLNRLMRDQAAREVLLQSVRVGRDHLRSLLVAVKAVPKPTA